MGPPTSLFPSPLWGRPHTPPSSPRLWAQTFAMTLRLRPACRPQKECRTSQIVGPLTLTSRRPPSRTSQIIGPPRLPSSRTFYLAFLPLLAGAASAPALRFPPLPLLVPASAAVGAQCVLLQFDGTLPRLTYGFLRASGALLSAKCVQQPCTPLLCTACADLHHLLQHKFKQGRPQKPTFLLPRCNDRPLTCIQS